MSANLPRRIYLAFLLLVSLWCALILVAPILQSAGGYTEWASALLYRSFGTICHQLDERSFHFGADKLAVCIRCASLYFGFWFTLLFYPLFQVSERLKSPPKVLLLTASSLMMIDAILSLTGIHSSTAATRISTGVLLGAILPFYLMPALSDAIEKTILRMRGPMKYFPSGD